MTISFLRLSKVRLLEAHQRLRMFSTVPEQERKMIMKKLLALSLLALSIFGSTLGPALAASESYAIGSERGARGWDGPQDPSGPFAPPG